MLGLFIFFVKPAFDAELKTRSALTVHCRRLCTVWNFGSSDAADFGSPDGHD